MQADGRLFEVRDGLVCVDADGCIALFGDFIRLQNQIFFHDGIEFISFCLFGFAGTKLAPENVSGVMFFDRKREVFGLYQ